MPQYSMNHFRNYEIILSGSIKDGYSKRFLHPTESEFCGVTETVSGRAKINCKLELLCSKVTFGLISSNCLSKLTKICLYNFTSNCPYPRQLEIDLWPWIIKVLKKSVLSSI